MTALSVRLLSGASAVLLEREVAGVLAVTEADAEALCARVRPLRARGPRGSLRYRLGDLLEADAASPAPETPRAPQRHVERVEAREPRGRARV